MKISQNSMSPKDLTHLESGSKAKNSHSVDPALMKAAQGMEALFVNYMMTVMRQTIPKNEMDLESPATEIYRSLLDTEFSNTASHSASIGLAEQIIAYLDQSHYNQK